MKLRETHKIDRKLKLMKLRIMNKTHDLVKELLTCGALTIQGKPVKLDIETAQKTIDFAISIVLATEERLDSSQLIAEYMAMRIEFERMKIRAEDAEDDAEDKNNIVQ